MRVHIVLPVVVFVMVGAALGCASTGGDAERALSAYLDATIHERYEEAYSYLSDDDQAAMTLEKFTGENSDNIVIRCDEFTSRTEFRVKNVDVDGDLARAEVEITEPNVRVILSDILGALIASLLDDEEEFENKYSEGDIPMRTRTEYYKLVREHGGWRVDL